jgi:hypothetical protein
LSNVLLYVKGDKLLGAIPSLGSENNTKSYIASFKKFFKYLVESNRISPNIEAEVRETLKEYKEEFLET